MRASRCSRAVRGGSRDFWHPAFALRAWSPERRARSPHAALALAQRERRKILTWVPGPRAFDDPLDRAEEKGPFYGSRWGSEGVVRGRTLLPSHKTDCVKGGRRPETPVFRRSVGSEDASRVPRRPVGALRRDRGMTPSPWRGCHVRGLWVGVNPRAASPGRRDPTVTRPLEACPMEGCASKYQPWLHRGPGFGVGLACHLCYFPRSPVPLGMEARKEGQLAMQALHGREGSKRGTGRVWNRRRAGVTGGIPRLTI